MNEPSYRRTFELLYNRVRVDTSDPARTFLFFPLKQLRKISPTTPLPAKREQERDCLTAYPVGSSGVAENATPFGDSVSFRGTRVGANHARLTIPVLIRPGTSEYAIPPNVSLKSLDDLERWLIEFCKKFELRPGLTPSVMLFKSVNSTTASADVAQDSNKMTYEIEGLNVEVWNTVHDAASFFAIFAPPAIPLAVIKTYIAGLEDALSDPPLPAKQTSDLASFLRTTQTATTTDHHNTLLAICAQSDTGDTVQDGKRLIMLSLLLRHISPTQHSVEGSRDTALHCAVRAKNYTIMKILLQRGADAGRRDGDFRTPLHLAARAGDATALALLLHYTRQHLTVNPIDVTMRTPLMDAAEARSVECVQLLLEAGANAAARDNMGETALHRLVVGGFDQKVALLLVKAGCPSSAVNNFALSASSLAAQKLVVFNIPEMEKKAVEVPILDKHLDFSFSTARHRSSQGAIIMDITNVERRPIFDYQFGLTINTKSECYVHLRPSSGWVVSYCKCEGPCKTCACIRVGNRGSSVFTSRGMLLRDFPQTQPIVMCTAACRCSKTCKLRTLSDCVSPRMEIFYHEGKKVWLVKTLDELERGQFVTFLGGEIIHPQYMDVKNKPHRYLLFSRTFSVDISRRANCSRFFDDSVQPNLQVVLVKEFDHTKPPQVAFFASEWIPKDEVLSYDKPKSFEIVQEALRDHCFSEYRFDE